MQAHFAKMQFGQHSGFRATFRLWSVKSLFFQTFGKQAAVSMAIFSRKYCNFALSKGQNKSSR